MVCPVQRWHLSETATNPHGVTHFTVICRDATQDSDYKEMLRVLKEVFGAVEDGVVRGPYSMHQFMKLDNLRFGIILDDPGWLDLYATEQHNVEVMASFVTRLLNTLNGQNTDQSG